MTNLTPNPHISGYPSGSTRVTYRTQQTGRPKEFAYQLAGAVKRSQIVELFRSDIRRQIAELEEVLHAPTDLLVVEHTDDYGVRTVIQPPVQPSIRGGGGFPIFDTSKNYNMTNGANNSLLFNMPAVTAPRGGVNFLSNGDEGYLKLKTDTDMRAFGFTDRREGFWFKAWTLDSDVSLNLSIRKDNGEYDLSVLNDAFGQPEYYGRMKPEFREAMIEKIEDIIEDLVENGFAVSIDHGEYGYDGD